MLERSARQTLRMSRGATESTSSSGPQTATIASSPDPACGVEHLSEAHFKTLKQRPEFPERFDNIEHARGHCRVFFDWYNHQHRHSGIELMTPAAIHFGQAPELHTARARVLDAAYERFPERFVRKPPVPPGAANRRVDQQARVKGGGSLNSLAPRLNRLDKFREPGLYPILRAGRVAP
jgi:hypothetical protein